MPKSIYSTVEAVAWSRRMSYEEYLLYLKTIDYQCRVFSKEGYSEICNCFENEMQRDFESVKD